MSDDDTPPTNLYQAANWLRERHPWAGQLVRRIAGDTEDWLEEVAGAILDTAENGEAWERYEQHNPPPRDRDDEAAHDRWEEAGPKNTGRGSAYAAMSGGEVRVIRLIATLANVRGEDYIGGEYRQYQRRVPWSAHDLGGWDDRGVAVFNDWVSILRTQVE